MTPYHPDSVVSCVTPLVVRGRSASTREAERERERAFDTAILEVRLTRSVAFFPSDGP
jgi:hypothetical protein